MENTRRRKTYHRTSASHRTSTTRRGRQPQKTNSDSFKEKILMQCIICGVIFLFVLVINLVNTELTSSIKQGLKSAIVSSTSVDDLKSSADGASNYFAVIQETVKTIFGYEKETDTKTPSEDVLLDEQPMQSDETVIEDSDFRIDEDILKMMNETPKKP